MIERQPGCEREPEVLDLLAIGGWPDRADDRLRNHVADCDDCRVLAMVVDALGNQSALAVVPRLPDARLIWHRAQMRARQDAVRRAARPLVMAEITAGAVFVVLVLTWAGGMTLPIDRMGDVISTVAGGLVSAARDVPATARAASLLVRDHGDAVAVLGRPLLLAAAVGAALVFAALGLSFLVDRSERT